MNAYWFFIVISWSLLMVAIGYGIGYGMRDREERARRVDWTPSRIEHKNVRNLNNYRALRGYEHGQRMAGSAGGRLRERV